MSADDNHDYRSREIEDMSDSYFRLGQGRISGTAAIFLGPLILYKALHVHSNAQTVVHLNLPNLIKNRFTFR